MLLYKNQYKYKKNLVNLMYIIKTIQIYTIHVKVLSLSLLWMNRNLRTDTIILRSRRIGELHKGLSCLTRDAGVLEVMAYGAGKGKSKLSGMIDPFSLLYFYLYFDPVKDNYKVTDIEQLNVFPEIRASLDKFYTASFWAELILRTFSGGGESEQIYPLLADSLKILNYSAEKDHILILLQFIWRYLGIAGFTPDIENCGRCGCSLSRIPSLWYSEAENYFLCNDCGAGNFFITISPGGVRYLKHTASLDISGSMKIGLDKRSAESLRRVLLAMIQGIVEYPLNTLKKGLLYNM